MIPIMPLPDLPTLRKLHRLDRSSPEFSDQLSDTLYGEEYQRCVQSLRDGDLLWVVDYLDKVCYHMSFPTPHSSQRRCLAISNLRTPLPGNVYVSSEAYVAPGGYSQHHTCFRLIF